MQNTVGRLLKEAREKKEITLEKIEKDTRIRLKNLQAIEDERWEEFPSKTYIQGVITSYGNYLELDTTKLLAYFRREYEQREKLKFKAKATKDQFTPQTKRVIRYAVLTVITLFVIYFGYQVSTLFTPPDIEILEPSETTTSKQKILLKGRTEKDTIVTVNDERVYLDDENIFQTEIPLTRDENMVKIEATGANGRTRTLEQIYIREFKE